MSTQIRNLGIFLMVCYLAVFVQLNRLTVFEADELQDDPRNNREVVRDFASPRGSIVTADNVLLARSVPVDSQYQFQREYPEGGLYGHITGYFSLRLGSTGLEQTYNSELAGRDLPVSLDSVGDYLLDDERVGNLTLSVRHDLQTQAQELLAGRNGSAVVMDPQTGAVQAMYANPTYDPNPLASHEFNRAERLSHCLNDDEPTGSDSDCPDDPNATFQDVPMVRRPDEPLLARTYRETFFPGSTFKVVTAAAGLQSGNVTPEEPVYEETSEYTPPNSGGPISNYGGNPCGGALFQILARSCNTSFMQMAVEDIGGEQLTRTAERFGFNQPPPLDLPDPAASNFPPASDFRDSGGFLALSAIGQYEVSASPLQMALTASAVANQGEIPEPHVVAQVRDNDDRLIRSNEPGAWQRALEEDDAATLRQGMIGVVTEGTAGVMQLDGYEVGAKTGTAELDAARTSAHAWIIGFAGPPGGDPEVAVAVLVEAQDGVSEATGGRVAGPIAAELLATALEEPTQPESNPRGSQ